MERVLILHNTFGSPDDPLYQSRAGVMDQVRAVEQSLLTLRIDYRIVPVENLKHLTGVLASCPEDLLFNLAEEFTGSADACYIPAVCNAFGKSCTGNDTPALLLSLNKTHAKAMLLNAGLPSPQGTVCHPQQPIDLSHLSADRYILKPACSDASEGITADSVIALPADLQKAVQYISALHAQFNQPAIIEQFIPARELNVSVVEINDTPTVMPLAEIDFSAFDASMHRIVDYAAKWHPDSFGFNNTPRKIPADLPEPAAAKVRSLAVAAWRALGCRDYARVDFRLDEDLNPYVLEINPNPDISPDAGFAAAIAAGGIPYEQFVRAMLDNALSRMKRRKQQPEAQAQG